MMGNRSALKEVPLRVRRMYAPPVIDEKVKDAQKENEEASRPLRFETSNYHDAGAEAEKRDDSPPEGEFTIQNEADE